MSRAAEASRRPSPQIINGDARLRMLRSDCAFFAEDVLGLEIGDHHEEWSDLQRTCDRISILAARGHGKSGFWSHAYPIWQSWRTPANTGLIVSNTEPQVAEFFRLIKEGKEFTDERGHVWKLPAVADVPFLHNMLPKGWERTWTESKIVFKNRSRFIGKTFGKRFRGGHYRWMVVDDGIGEEAQYSEMARERAWDFLTRTLSPMILPGGQLTSVGTPLHADDIHGRLAKNGEYTQRRYPAISRDPETGQERVLWQEFRPRKWLDAKRREVGDLAFAQEYLLSPATSEASLFPPRLFTARRETLDQSIPFRPSPDTIKAMGWSIFFGVDVAQSAEVAADFFVITVMAVNDMGVRWVIDLFREKGLGFNSQLAVLEDMGARYDPDLIYIESNAAQRIYGDEMMRTTDLPVGKFVTTAGGKNNLESGVPGLRTLLENGRLRLARGDAAAIEGTDVLMFELGCFSWVGGKLQGVGAHDDTVMSAWLCDQAVRASRRMSFWSANGDAAVDEQDETPPLPPGDLSIPVAQAPLSLPGAGAEPEHDEAGVSPVADAPNRAGDAAPATTAARASPEVIAGRVRELLDRPRAAIPPSTAKREAIHHGHVPPGCTVPAELAQVALLAEVEAGRDPCAVCDRDRQVCRGRPRAELHSPWRSRRRAMMAAAGLDLDEDDEPPPKAAPAPPAPPVASVLAAAGVVVDAASVGLAEAFPRDRSVWIAAWNATRTGSGMPSQVAALVTRYGEAAVVTVLRGCLGV